MKKKKCFKCGATKPLSDFYRHKQMRDGHLGKCKACTKKESRANWVTTTEKAKVYDAWMDSLNKSKGNNESI